MRNLLNFALLSMAAIRSASSGKTLVVSNFPKEQERDEFNKKFMPYFLENNDKVSHLENPSNLSQITSELSSEYDSLVFESHGNNKDKIPTINCYGDEHIPFSDFIKKINSARKTTLNQIHISSCFIGRNVNQLLDSDSYYYHELNRNMENNQLLFLHGDEYIGDLVQSYGDRLPHLTANKEYSIIEALLDSGEGLNVILKKENQLKVFIAKSFGRNGEEWIVENYRNYLNQVAAEAKEFEVENNILAADAKRPDISKLSDEELNRSMGDVFYKCFYKLLDAKDFDQIYKIIDKTPNLNLQDKDGFTALINAIDKGHLDIAKTLIEKGADSNLKDKNGWTALTHAAAQNHINIVKSLIENGTNLDIQNKDGRTALMIAINKGHLNIAKTLIENSTNLDIQNKDGRTALMYAADKGHLDIVEALIAKGANLDLKENAGWTALKFAFFQGFSSVANILIKSGADVSAIGSSLENLFSSKNLQDPKQTKDLLEIACTLQEKGITVPLKADFLEKSFLVAAKNGETNLLRFLLEKGVKIDEEKERILLAEIAANPKENANLAEFLNINKIESEPEIIQKTESVHKKNGENYHLKIISEASLSGDVASVAAFQLKDNSKEKGGIKTNYIY